MLPSLRVTGQEQISALLHEREAATGRAYFAEEFIDGREFNLSLIGPGPQVLPPAEIDFSTFPRGKERIVGHSAKCDQTSFEYQQYGAAVRFSCERPAPAAATQRASGGMLAIVRAMRICARRLPR